MTDTAASHLWPQFRPEWVLLLVFIAISISLVPHHEPYQDEAQAWLIARDSPDPLSILKVTGYEGSPGLWHLLLFPLSHAGLPYESMAILHTVLISAALAVFLFYSPFSLLQKSLFTFSYFMIYEYNIIARSYALSILILFLIAALYQDRQKRPIAFGALLALLANTNVHGLIIALILGIIFLIDIYPVPSGLQKNLALWGCIFTVGIACAISQLFPPPDLVIAWRSWDLSPTIWHFGVPFRAFYDAFLPIPKIQLHFWNTRLIPYPTMLGLIIAPLSLLFFARKPRALMLYLFLVTGVGGLFFLKHQDILRHHGLLFMIFLFCLWLFYRNLGEEWPVPAWLQKITDSFTVSRLFTVILALQVVGSPIAYYYDYLYPFSQGKETARFLIEENYFGNDSFVVAYPSNATLSLTPYLSHQERLFCLQYGGYCTFSVWNTTYEHSRVWDTQTILEHHREAASQFTTGRNILVVDRNIPQPYLEKFNGRLIISFNQSIIGIEDFYLYTFGS